MEIHSLQDANHPLWQQSWALYNASFDKCELRTLRLHRQVMQDQDFFCNAYTDGDTFVGILFYWQGSQFCFIEHFAIEPSLRGKNYGSRILSSFCAHQKAVLLEIEVPNDAYKIRRQHFYERLGFVKNDYLHIHHPYHAGMPPHELNVMSLQPLTPAQYERFYQFWKDRVMQGSDAYLEESTK